MAHSGCRGTLLAACCLSALGAPAPFSFMVIGDRTGSARPDVFRRVVDDAALLNPDFIICTGDLIEGNTDDTAALKAQWDTVLGLLATTGKPVYLAPGNNEISSPAAESVFLQRVGPTNHVVRHANATFIFLDNSRSPAVESLPQRELLWLLSELNKAKRSRHVFVVMHRPFWRYARENKLPDPLHDLFRQYNVRWVFTGHDHFYCWARLDDINYFQVGPSGSRPKVSDDPARGAFQNYLFFRVKGTTVSFELREPGRERPLQPDTVTLGSLEALNRARRDAVTIPPIPVGGAGIAAEVPLTLRNVTEKTVTGKIVWRDSGTSWRITPRELSYSITRDGRVSQQVKFALPAADSLYPLPGYSLPYAYLPGRLARLASSLPVRREATVLRPARRPVIDGKLTEELWQHPAVLRSFGDEVGNLPRVEATEVWIAADDSLLYIAARCRETEPKALRAAATARDGKVLSDDNLDLVLDFDRGQGPDSGIYFQIFVNPAGTIADRRCSFMNGTSRKDYSWNGRWKTAATRGADFWQAELRCPLSDFGTLGQTWGVNAVRFQSRLKDKSVWQVPFQDDPSFFGILTR